jgi:hypothetical protein
MDILEALNRASENAANLDDAVYLQKAAEEFLGAYAAFEGYEVVAASSVAERVLGAAMMLKPALSMAGRGRTVIFDVNIASGTLMARAARRLRQAGNSEDLVGIALHSLMCEHGGVNDALGELTKLVVTHAQESQTSGIQCSDSCDSRVGLTV